MGVVDLLDLSEAAIVVLEGGLVERFRLIKTVSVGSALLVAVHVLLGVPAGAIPQSRVARVSTGKRVDRRLLVVSVCAETRLTFDRGESELSRLLESHVVTIAVIRSG